MLTLHLIFLVVLLIVALVLSSLFSGSETAITACNSALLVKMRDEGNIRAAKLLKLYSRKEQVIGAILLGNNFVNILASSVSTFLVIEMFGGIGILISTVLVSVVIVMFGEIIPKTYAIKHPESLGMKLAGFISITVKICDPIIKYINYFTTLFLKLCIPSSNIRIASPYDTLKGIITLHKQRYTENNVQKSLELISNIVDITEVHVDKIMTHRQAIHSMRLDSSKETIIEDVLSHQYGLVPMWQNRDDNYAKILNAGKLRMDLFRGLDITIDNYLLEPFFTPDTTPVSVQLHNFKTNKSDFAVVVDEYGNAIGIITVYDVLEEILGEALYTHNYYDIKQNSDGSYVIMAGIPIRDLNKKLNLNFPTTHNHTFAGMIIDEIERIPDEGEVLNIHSCSITILKKKHNKIVRVLLIKL